MFSNALPYIERDIGAQKRTTFREKLPGKVAASPKHQYVFML